MKKLTHFLCWAKTFFSFALILVFTMRALAQQWIPIPQEAKPYTRWWWLGSAVDSAGLDYNLSAYAKAGIGGVEITPIYGVQKATNNITYLSSEWMNKLKKVNELGSQNDIQNEGAVPCRSYPAAARAGVHIRSAEDRRRRRQDVYAQG